MNWIKDTVSGLLSFAEKPLTEWQRRKTLKVEEEAKQLARDHELRLKKVDANLELAKQGIQVEADWDARAQEDMKHSWKDEWFVFLFSVPLVLAFIPACQEAVLKGFETLNKTPEWYITLVVGIVAATFGLRWLVSRKGKR